MWGPLTLGAVEEGVLLVRHMLDQERAFKVALRMWGLYLLAVSEGVCEDPSGGARELLKLRCLDYGPGRCIL